MKFTIIRDKWQRGNPELAKLLSSETQKMCCLGFFGLACGYSKEDIVNRADPAECSADAKKSLWPTWAVIKRENTVEVDFGEYEERTEWLCEDVMNRLMNINDNTEANDKWREKEIASIFAEHGVEVQFI